MDTQPEIESQTDDATESEEAPPDPAPAPPERVALPPAGGRRGAAAAKKDEILTTLRSLQDTVAKQREEHTSALASRDAEIARLRGSYEAIQPLIQQRQAPTAERSFEQVVSESKAALDRGDLDTYHAKVFEAADIRAMQKFEEKYGKQLQQQQAPQQSGNPLVAALMASHPHVMSSPNGEALVRHHAEGLVLEGAQPSPALLARAFKEVNDRLAAKAKEKEPPQFDTNASRALSGPPPSRTNGKSGGQGPGVELTELEKQWAKQADMTLEEYAADVAKYHPERIVR